MPAPARTHCRITSQCNEGQPDIGFMKRPSGKLVDDAMRFFTRELYTRFNSSNALEADEADKLWEQASVAYRRHLRQLSKKLPDSARALSKLCLHDAELMNPKRRDPFLVHLPEVASVGVVKRFNGDGRLAYLITYSLFENVREASISSAWPFSKKNVRWLYDEIDASESGAHRFVHRILLSDGRVVVIPFTNLGVHELTTQIESMAGMVVQSA